MPIDEALEIIAENSCSEISLISEEIDDEETEVLASALQKNNTIRKVDLSNNHIGDSGAKAIAKAFTSSILLRRNNTLMEINLSCNDISDMGACAFAEALEKNNTLIKLNLFGNNIGNKGAIAFIKLKMSKKNDTITEIELDGNHIDETLLGLIDFLLQYNFELRYLNKDLFDRAAEVVRTIVAPKEQEILDSYEQQGRIVKYTRRTLLSTLEETISTLTRNIHDLEQMILLQEEKYLSLLLPTTPERESPASYVRREESKHLLSLLSELNKEEKRLRQEPLPSREADDFRHYAANFRHYANKIITSNRKINLAVQRFTEILKQQAIEETLDPAVTKEAKEVGKLTDVEIEKLNTFEDLLDNELSSLFVRSMAIAHNLASPPLSLLRLFSFASKISASFVPLPGASMLVGFLTGAAEKIAERREEYQSGQFAAQVGCSVHKASDLTKIIVRLLAVRHQRHVLCITDNASLELFTKSLTARMYAWITQSTHNSATYGRSLATAIIPVSLKSVNKLCGFDNKYTKYASFRIAALEMVIGTSLLKVDSWWITRAIAETFGSWMATDTNKKLKLRAEDGSGIFTIDVDSLCSLSTVFVITDQKFQIYQIPKASAEQNRKLGHIYSVEEEIEKRALTPDRVAPLHEIYKGKDSKEDKLLTRTRELEAKLAEVEQDLATERLENKVLSSKLSNMRCALYGQASSPLSPPHTSPNASTTTPRSPTSQ